MTEDDRGGRDVRPSSVVRPRALRPSRPPSAKKARIHLIYFDIRPLLDFFVFLASSGDLK